jgi:SAM-dependent methyltransferase
MTLNKIKKLIPWQARILAKLILSRLPVNYWFWSRLGLFRHGNMDDYSYAWNVLQKHSQILREAKGWRGLELGPGDGLLSSLLAPAAFSSGLVLLDVGEYAHKNIKLYLDQVKAFLAAHPEFELPNYAAEPDLASILSKANGRYLCEGLKSLRTLAQESFDLIFSQAVLEHIRRDEFKEMMQETYRLVKPSGVVSHVIDFKDHLGGALNNMRIHSDLWERPWFAARSGFYTNRLRLSEIINICQQIGFKVQVCNVRRWDDYPLNRALLSHEFNYLSDEDLSVSGAHLIMRRE